MCLEMINILDHHRIGDINEEAISLIKILSLSLDIGVNFFVILSFSFDNIDHFIQHDAPDALVLMLGEYCYSFDFYSFWLIVLPKGTDSLP